MEKVQLFKRLKPDDSKSDEMLNQAPFRSSHRRADGSIDGSINEWRGAVCLGWGVSGMGCVSEMGSVVQISQAQQYLHISTELYGQVPNPPFLARVVLEILCLSG